MKKKNLLTAALSLSLIGVIAVGGTLAYFTDKTDAKTNTFTAGNVEIELIDKSENGDGRTAGRPNADGNGITYSNVMPGDVLSKEVSVKVDDSSQSAWVALKLTVDTTLPQDSKLNKDDVEKEIWKMIKKAVAEEQSSKTEGTGVWNKEGDIFYYDQHPEDAKKDKGGVDATQTADYLFKGLTIPTTWGNEYEGISFSIKVEAAAVQQANLTYDEAKKQLKNLLNSTTGT